jgi:hypothetical protein
LGQHPLRRVGPQDLQGTLAPAGLALKAALAKVPGLKVTSVEKLTQKQLADYEKSPPESLEPGLSAKRFGSITLLPIWALGPLRVEPRVNRFERVALQPIVRVNERLSLWPGGFPGGGPGAPPFWTESFRG